jgi:hypothetical protein
MHVNPSDIQTIGFYLSVIVFVVLVIPKSGRRWIKRRFQELDFLEKYFRILFTRWQAAIWGGSVLAVAFSWHFITSDWPPYVKLTMCVVALFFAGYYVWRTDHIRLTPKFVVTKLCPPNETDTEDTNQTNLFIQIIPECLSDAPVHGCRARVLQVSKRFENEDEWRLTTMDSPLFLEWDYYGACEFTLEPGIRQRLNICWWSNRSRLIIPSVNPLPSKFRNVFNDFETFKFDIRFTAREAEPVDVSVLVSLRNRGWNNPIISLVQGPGNADKE